MEKLERDYAALQQQEEQNRRQEQRAAMATPTAGANRGGGGNPPRNQEAAGVAERPAVQVTVTTRAPRKFRGEKPAKWLDTFLEYANLVGYRESEYLAVIIDHVGSETKREVRRLLAMDTITNWLSFRRQFLRQFTPKSKRPRAKRLKKIRKSKDVKTTIRRFDRALQRIEEYGTVVEERAKTKNLARLMPRWVRSSLRTTEGIDTFTYQQVKDKCLSLAAAEGILDDSSSSDSSSDSDTSDGETDSDDESGTDSDGSSSDGGSSSSSSSRSAKKKNGRRGHKSKGRKDKSKSKDGEKKKKKKHKRKNGHRHDADDKEDDSTARRAPTAVVPEAEPKTDPIAALTDQFQRMSIRVVEAVQQALGSGQGAMPPVATRAARGPMMAPVPAVGGQGPAGGYPMGYSPMAARLRTCLYCDSPQHDKFTCPLLQDHTAKGKVQYGERGHLFCGPEKLAIAVGRGGMVQRVYALFPELRGQAAQPAAPAATSAAVQTVRSRNVRVSDAAKGDGDAEAGVPTSDVRAIELVCEDEGVRQEVMTAFARLNDAELSEQLDATEAEVRAIRRGGWDVMDLDDQEPRVQKPQQQTTPPGPATNVFGQTPQQAEQAGRGRQDTGWRVRARQPRRSAFTVEDMGGPATAAAAPAPGRGRGAGRGGAATATGPARAAAGPSTRPATAGPTAPRPATGTTRQQAPVVIADDDGAENETTGPRYRWVNELNRYKDSEAETRRLLEQEVPVKLGTYLALSPEMTRAIAAAIRRRREVVANVNLAVCNTSTGTTAWREESAEGNRVYYAVAGYEATVTLMERPLRAVLDPGSEVNLISEKAARDLALPVDTTMRWELNVPGVAASQRSRALGVVHPMPLAIGGVQGRVALFVVKNVTFDLLLGRPFEIEFAVSYLQRQGDTYAIVERAGGSTELLVSRLSTPRQGTPNVRAVKVTGIQEGNWTNRAARDPASGREAADLDGQHWCRKLARALGQIDETTGVEIKATPAGGSETDTGGYNKGAAEEATMAMSDKGPKATANLRNQSGDTGLESTPMSRHDDEDDDDDDDDDDEDDDDEFYDTCSSWGDDEGDDSEDLGTVGGQDTRAREGPGSKGTMQPAVETPAAEWHGGGRDGEWEVEVRGTRVGVRGYKKPYLGRRKRKKKEEESDSPAEGTETARLLSAQRPSKGRAGHRKRRRGRTKEPPDLEAGSCDEGGYDAKVEVAKMDACCITDEDSEEDPESEGKRSRGRSQQQMQVFRLLPLVVGGARRKLGRRARRRDTLRWQHVIEQEEGTTDDSEEDHEAEDEVDSADEAEDAALGTSDGRERDKINDDNDDEEEEYYDASEDTEAEGPGSPSEKHKTNRRGRRAMWKAFRKLVRIGQLTIPTPAELKVMKRKAKEAGLRRPPPQKVYVGGGESNVDDQEEVEQEYEEFLRFKERRDAQPNRWSKERLAGVNTGILNTAEKEELYRILRARDKSFAWSDKERGFINPRLFPPIKLPTGRHRVWTNKEPSFGPEDLKEVVALLKDKVESNMLEGSRSAYSSAWFVLRKPNGKLRFIQDLRPLNRVSPLLQSKPPNIRSVLERVCGRACISTLDQFSGYDSISIARRYRPLTALRTPLGLFQLKSLPQGYINSVQLYMEAMRKVFQDFLLHEEEDTDELDIYVDDFYLLGIRMDDLTEEQRATDEHGRRGFIMQHLALLDRVLERAADAGLVFSGAKFKIAQLRARVLGYEAGAEGWRPMEDAAKAVREYPSPGDAGELRSFMGLVQFYGPFIPRLGQVSRILYALLKKGASWKWCREHEDALRLLCNTISSRPILAPVRYKDWNKAPLEFWVDACHTGLGCALMQKDKHGRRRPVAFRSIPVTGARQNYGSTKLEVLALYDALRAYGHLVRGRHFEVYTDNTGLEGLANGESLATQTDKTLLRWMTHIRSYSFTAHYVKGRDNPVADALSRIAQNVQEPDKPWRTMDEIGEVEDLWEVGGEDGAEDEEWSEDDEERGVPTAEAQRKLWREITSEVQSEQARKGGDETYVTAVATGGTGMPEDDGIWDKRLPAVFAVQSFGLDEGWEPQMLVVRDRGMQTQEPPENEQIHGEVQTQTEPVSRHDQDTQTRVVVRDAGTQMTLRTKDQEVQTWITTGHAETQTPKKQYVHVETQADAADDDEDPELDTVQELAREEREWLRRFLDMDKPYPKTPGGKRFDPAN